MRDLLFIPTGTINSAQFMRAGFILILIGTALGFVKMISPTIGGAFSIFSLFLGYPWMVIWVKRLRYGGKSETMVFLYLLIYGVSLFFGFVIVIFMFGGPEFMALINAKVAGTISQAEYISRAQNMAPRLMLPSLISGILSSLLTLYIGDRTIPSPMD